MKNQFKIVVVIPTFNRKNLLLEAISSIEQQSINVYKIIIIDSCSTDGTIDAIKSLGNTKIEIINGTSDWWWAKCMNEGILRSKQYNADFILALNDDSKLSTDTLKFLLETSSRLQGFIIGSIVRDINNISNSITGGHGAKFTKFRWIPDNKILTEINEYKVYYTEGQSGRGVLFPIEVFYEVGLYDEINFPQHADRDFSFRCLKNNIGQCLDSRAITYLNFESTQFGMNENRLKFRDLKLILFDKKGIYNIKNQYRFLRKHYKLWPFWLSIWLIIISSIVIVRLIPGGTYLIRNQIPQLLNKNKNV